MSISCIFKYKKSANYTALNYILYKNIKLYNTIIYSYQYIIKYIRSYNIISDFNETPRNDKTF